MIFPLPLQGLQRSKELTEYIYIQILLFAHLISSLDLQTAMFSSFEFSQYIFKRISSSQTLTFQFHQLCLAFLCIFFSEPQNISNTPYILIQSSQKDIYSFSMLSVYFCVSLINVAQMVKNPPARQETWVRSLGWEDPLDKGMATHSSILA